MFVEELLRAPPLAMLAFQFTIVKVTTFAVVKLRGSYQEDLKQQLPKLYSVSKDIIRIVKFTVKYEGRVKLVTPWLFCSLTGPFILVS